MAAVPIDSDSSAALKQTPVTLLATWDTVLNSSLRDEETGDNARVVMMVDYGGLNLRFTDLPPSIRSSGSTCGANCSRNEFSLSHSETGEGNGGARTDSD